MLPNNTPAILFTYSEDHRTVLTAYKDGHVEAADPSKLDEAAQEFWRLLAGEFAFPKHDPAMPPPQQCAKGEYLVECDPDDRADQLAAENAKLRAEIAALRKQRKAKP